MGVPPGGFADWGEYFADVRTTAAGRRAYVSNLYIEGKKPGMPPALFNQPSELQGEAQSAYEDPEVELTVDVKARQVGRSTQEGANNFATAHSADGAYRILVATNHTSTTDSSMRRYEFFVSTMDPDLKAYAPVRINRNKGEVHFERNSSLIKHVTVGGTSKAKSWGYHAVTAEEMGMWPDADNQWASIQATLPEHAPTHIISTPTGPGTLYARKVQEAKRAVEAGDKSVRLNFWPWFRHPEYLSDNTPEDWEPDQAEADYAADIGVNPETTTGKARLYWRHQKIWGPKGVGLALFRRDFPSNLEEGFLAWGGCWFDLENLNRLITVHEAQPQVGGELRFYRRPEMGMSYAMGIDSAWCNGGDLGVAVVVDAKGRLCAVLAQQFGGEVLFAQRCAALARAYKARVLAEDNGPGKVVLRYLFDEGVNLWWDVSSGKRKGWTTTGQTRPELLSHIRQEVDSGALLIPDLAILRQLTHFRDEKGRVEGQDGEGDDYVFALALAAWNLRTLPGRVTVRFRPERAERVVRTPVTKADARTAIRTAMQR